MRVTTWKEDTGYSYEVRRVDGRVLARGWSAGSRRDALDDAERVTREARSREGKEVVPRES